METKKAAGIGLITVAGGIAAYQLLKGKEPVHECSVDADCPAGYKCEGGICVPEFPEHIEYEEEGIKLKELKVSSPTVVGYPVTVSCWALSNRTQTKTFTLYVNGSEVNRQTIQFTTTFLWDTKKVELEYIPENAGIYAVRIALSPHEVGISGSFEATAPVFTNIGLELVKSALEFPDEVRAAYTRTQGDFSGPFLSGISELKEAYFTFDPTVVQPEYECYYDEDCAGKECHPFDCVCRGGKCVSGPVWKAGVWYPPPKIPNANLNCTISLDLGGYSGWTLGATLIAIKASEYQSWLNDIRFIDWGHPGKLGGGIYGLGFPCPLLDSQGYPAHAAICPVPSDVCKFVHHEEKYRDGLGRCTLSSGDHEFNVNGLLDLEPGSWVVLASFVMSICNAFESPGPRGTTHMTYLPLNCYNYKIYKVGTISF